MFKPSVEPITYGAYSKTPSDCLTTILWKHVCPDLEIPPLRADWRSLLCFLCSLCCVEELQGLTPAQGQRHTPVEGRVSLEHVNAHVLLHEAVQENREGSAGKGAQESRAPMTAAEMSLHTAAGPARSVLRGRRH